MARHWQLRASLAALGKLELGRLVSDVLLGDRAYHLCQCGDAAFPVEGLEPAVP